MSREMKLGAFFVRPLNCGELAVFSAEDDHFSSRLRG